MAPPATAPDLWSAAVDRACVAVDLDGRPALRVRHRMWTEKDGGWFDHVVQYLYAEPRTPGRAATVHDDLAGWAEETRAWALLAFVDAALDVRVWRASIELGSVLDVPDEDLASLPFAPNADPDSDPVFAALDRVEDAQAGLRRAEVRRVTAALTAWRAALRQEDRPGASGTPYQTGFFIDLGKKLQVADTTARALVHTADDLAGRTPKVWSAFLEGDVTWRAMQIVHAELDGLDPEFLAEFDARAVAKIGEVQAPGLRDALRRVRERLQASTADERHERARERRRITIESGADGMGWLHAYLPMPELLGLDRQLTKASIGAAGTPGEERGVGVLRADVFQDFVTAFLRTAATPGEDVLVPGRTGVEPRVVVLIPAMTALGHSTAPATLKGYGTIGIRTALKLAGTATAWVRVLTDPITGGVIDVGRKRYRPSRDMRVLLSILDGGGRGPNCPRGPDETDVDHVDSFTLHGGQGRTALDNLVLLSRKHHGAKTAGEARTRLLPDRTHTWTTRAGNTYLTRPADPLEPTPIPDDLIDPDDCPF